MPKIGMTELAPALSWPKYFYQGFNRQYFRKVLAERPIAYWPLWEASGSVAYDISKNGLHGAYDTVTLGQDGPGHGRSCALFDGANSFVNLYSAALNTAFDGAEVTFVIRCKMSDVSQWSDDGQYHLFRFAADANNQTLIKKQTDNTIIGQVRSGGTWVDKSQDCSGFTDDWYCFALTVSETNDRLRFFSNGVQLGLTQTGLGNWAGNLDATMALLGGWSTGSINLLGCLSDFVVFDRELSVTEIARISLL